MSARLRFAVDENFNNRILTGLRRRFESLEALSVREAGLSGADDPTVLEWAASEERILLTHDISTITKFAYQRIQRGLPMPGVIEVHASAPMGQVLDDLELLIELAQPSEFDQQILYVPI